MNRTTTLVIAVVLVMIGVFGITATVQYAQRDMFLEAATAGGVDAMFIEEMIPHHDDAIEMAELALTRAEHPEIRELAAVIKRTQTAENSQMRAWYREWFGTTVPDVGVSSRMMGGMMGSGTADMADLEGSEPFDKAFIELMIPHHQMAVMMSQMAGGASGRPEMRELTSTIIETQSIEIAKMQAWYNEWYGR